MKYEVWRMKNNKKVKCVESCKTVEVAQDICDTYAHAYPDQDFAVEEVKIA